MKKIDTNTNLLLLLNPMPELHFLVVNSVPQKKNNKFLNSLLISTTKTWSPFFYKILLPQTRTKQPHSPKTTTLLPPTPQNKTHRSNFTLPKLAHPVFFSLTTPYIAFCNRAASSSSTSPLSCRPSGTRIARCVPPNSCGGACKLAPIYYLRTLDWREKRTHEHVFLLVGVPEQLVRGVSGGKFRSHRIGELLLKEKATLKRRAG